MQQIKEVLRLRLEAGLAYSQIALACGLSKGVVSKYLSLAKAQGIGWPLPEGLDAPQSDRGRVILAIPRDVRQAGDFRCRLRALLPAKEAARWGTWFRSFDQAPRSVLTVVGPFVSARCREVCQ